MSYQPYEYTPKDLLKDATFPVRDQLTGLNQNSQQQLRELTEVNAQLKNANQTIAQLSQTNEQQLDEFAKTNKKLSAANQEIAKLNQQVSELTPKPKKWYVKNLYSQANCDIINE